MAGLRARKRQRLLVVSVSLAAFILAVLTALLALGGDSLSLFLQPSDVSARVAAGDLKAGDRIRLGGLVAPGSVTREDVVTQFVITDCAATVTVRYAGLLPDLFKEGQGVVTEGIWQDGGAFTASSVLAKHDENYAPPGTLPDNPEACTHPESTYP